MREWKKFDNDEIITIWKGYLATEFPHHDNLLHLIPEFYKNGVFRLTPLEIIRLVEELMERLEFKMKDGKVEIFKDE
jgi:hypothetical protein